MSAYFPVSPQMPARVEGAEFLDGCVLEPGIQVQPDGVAAFAWPPVFGLRSGA